MNNNLILICPGIHQPELTTKFLTNLQQQCHEKLDSKFLIFPTQNYPAYSAFHILKFLHKNSDFPNQLNKPIIFISFSAGVVGVIGAAWAWQSLGGKITAFIGIDGWGVPLYGNFPIHRLSHDYFTHGSSALLGAGEDSFYAEPAVEHLDLWRAPQTAQGWSLTPEGKRTSVNAAEFIANLLTKLYS